jgi:catechol 2,3-dioxygenase-like lactoylglutathione lyase family enzyme
LPAQLSPCFRSVVVCLAHLRVASRDMRDGQPFGRSDIESIGAVALVTHDMARSIGFYTSLGFDLINGGAEAGFSSFAIGDGFLNLMARPGVRSWSGWGRLILYVSDVDEHYRNALEVGLTPEAPPRDAEWGERYFHLTDPDGHELSFARPLTPR